MSFVMSQPCLDHAPPLNHCVQCPVQFFKKRHCGALFFWYLITEYSLPAVVIGLMYVNFVSVSYSVTTIVVSMCDLRWFVSQHHHVKNIGCIENGSFFNNKSLNGSHYLTLFAAKISVFIYRLEQARLLIPLQEK